MPLIAAQNVPGISSLVIHQEQPRLDQETKGSESSWAALPLGSAMSLYTVW